MSAKPVPVVSPLKLNERRAMEQHATATNPIATRPTSLFGSKSTDGINVAAAAAAFSATSPSSGGGSAASSPSSFMPEMPQWKKELIQRRKYNVVRTISANGAPATAAHTARPDHTAADVFQSNDLVSSSSISKQFQSNARGSKELTSAENAAISGEHENQPQRAFPIQTTARASDIMPAVDALNSPTHTVNMKISPTSTLTKQRAEKFIGVGGHYTAQVTDNHEKSEQMEKADHRGDNVARAEQAAKFLSDMSPTRSTTIIPKPRQRSAAFASTMSAARNQTKEHAKKETACTTSDTSSFSANAEVNSHTSEKRATTPAQSINISLPNTNAFESNTKSTCLTGSADSLLRAREHNDYGIEERIEEIQSTTRATVTTSQSTGAFQSSQFKAECEWSSEVVGEKRTASTVAINDKKTVKISNKLQNNQFIKNQSQTRVGGKYIKSSEQECDSSSSIVGKTASHCTATTKKKMVAVQEMKKTTQNVSYHQHHHQHHRHQQQEIIDGTATACEHREQPQRMLQLQTPSQSQSQSESDSQSQPQSYKDEASFDSNEDLSYGPGIVSKLRCRYLSLAVRASMEEEQRHILEKMRRATSLNNLLDHDDRKHKSITIKQYDRDSQLQQEDIADNKKTATFQNSLTNANADNEAKKVAPEPAARSRHLKRGNDSLKRARSVEALLCERTPWNFIANRSSLNTSTTTSTTTANSTATVTIEDKISNARERLVLGVDSMPPKRLTSIISDTERPPPDLVKQTLKLFEATANRRGRGTANANAKGEVASKVANYKSIIKENKPTIFPKPSSLSPSKRVTAKATQKTANELTASNGITKTDVESSERTMKPSTVTPSHKIEHNNRDQWVVSRVGSTPPVAVKLTTKASCSSTLKGAVNGANELIDSPVTALTKKLEQLNIGANSASVKKDLLPTLPKRTTTSAAENELVTKIDAIGSTPNDNNIVVNVEETVGVGVSVGGVSGSVKKETVSGGNMENENENMVAVASVDAAIDADANADAEVNISRQTESEESADDGGAGADGARVAENSNDKNDRVTAREHDLQTGIVAYVSDSSDLSDGEYGGPTKRISKASLDNIARAGTSQQFRFDDNSLASNNSNGVQKQNTNVFSSQLANDATTSSVLNTPSGKQVGIIRPLLTTSSPTTSSLSSTTSVAAYTATSVKLVESSVSASSESTNTTLPDSIKQQQIYKYTYASASTVTQSSSSSSVLTNREIEKNRINEMKNTASTELSNAMAATNTSLLDTVITASSISSSTSSSGYSELDAVTANNSSPLWALRKKRPTPTPAAENTSMVFNFSNRKEVPDYIENDGVIFRRKRELPKPNESGFVLLTDLSLETSTDTDYDDFVASPPSPCNVVFENANVVIDGKSSIRQKAKEATFRVQFDDSLTSTFEYPSESSMIIDNDEHHSHLYGHSEDLVRAFENFVASDVDSPQHRHHHVAVDEIIQLPTQSANAGSPAETSASPLAKNILGNLPLGSAPLGFYSPIKAPINNLFQLGVTRVPSANANGHSDSDGGNAHNGATATSLMSNGFNGNGSILGISNGLINDSDQPNSQEYLKPANDDHTVAYSEGAHRTDLLY